MSEMNEMTPPSPDEQPEKKSSWGLVFRLVGMAAMVIVMVCGPYIRQRRAQEFSQWNGREGNTRQIAAADIPEEIFLGRVQMIEAESAVAASWGLVMTQTVAGEAVELAFLPFSMEVRPDLPGIMFLEFQDDAGTVYPFAAAYSLSGGALTLQAPEEADCAQLESETEAYHVLTQSLTYDVYLEDGEIWLRNVPAWGTYRNQGTTDTSVILQGVACSDTDIYQGIAAVDLVAAREGTGLPCRLIFKGGGYSTDAEVISFGFDYVTVSMRHEMVSSESGMQEAARRHTYALEFYNNYPYGFIVRDGEDYYFYQRSVAASRD